MKNDAEETSFYELKKIVATDDAETMKECLEDKNETKLLENHKKVLLMRIAYLTKKENVDFIKSYLMNSYSYNENMDKDFLKYLSLIIDDEKWFTSFLRGKGIKLSNIERINLPKDMTFGYEIEVEYTGPKKTIKWLMPNGWEEKREDTLLNGQEMVSPILKNNANTIQDIYYVCSVLKLIREEKMDRSGGHIHIGANYLDKKGKRAYINFLELFANSEEILYIISNESNQVPRENVLYYARPITSGDMTKKAPKIFSSRNFKSLLQELQEKEFVEEADSDYRTNRYYDINFSNLGAGKIDTIEFRIPNGTLDADTWIRNNNLIGNMVRVSEELVEIEELLEKVKKEDISKISRDTKNKLRKWRLFRTLKTQKLYERKKLDILLNILFDNEEQKNIYKTRYTRNRAKVGEDNPYKTLNNPIDLQKLLAENEREMLGEF